MNGVRWSKIDNNIINPDKIVIVGSGPSLKDFDTSLLRDKGYYIITINNSYKIVPFAQAWFTLDPWGLNGKQLPPKNLFNGELFCAVPEDFATPLARYNDHKVIYPIDRNIKFLHRIVFHTVTSISDNDYLNWGLNEDPSCINTLNSGFGALNLAYHMRPRKILLLGIDASTGYFDDVDKKTRSLNHLPAIFKSSVKQLQKANISVINGSLHSKIECFSKFNIMESLREFDNG